LTGNDPFKLNKEKEYNDSGKPSLLTPNTGHLANTFSRPLTHESMVLGFVLNGNPYQLQKIGIPFTISQGTFNINLLVRKKTASQMTFGSQPQSIADLTKMIA
jgi:hypothetical protein